MHNPECDMYHCIVSDSFYDAFACFPLLTRQIWLFWLSEEEVKIVCGLEHQAQLM